MRIIGDLVIAGFGQVKNARIENVATDPASPQNGQVWFNTTDSVYRGFDGTNTITFASGGNTQLIIDALNAEVARATAAEATLTTNLAAEVTRATAAEGINAADILAEVARAQAAEATLTTNLAAEATTARAAESANATAITTEASARSAADTALQGNIDTEASARAAADTAEAAARASADTLIRTDFAAADALISGNLTAEVTRATAAEAALATADSNEAAARAAADTALDGRLTTVEGSYIHKDGSVAFTGDQSMGSHALTNVATPVAAADAANKDYVDSKLSSLGNAFEYVGSVSGGVDAGTAFDLSTLTTKHAGAYYKVSVGGYFVVGDGAAFFANATDGLVFNTATAVDVIDNTNSHVQGTVNFIAVSGNADTGYTVDVDTTFKGRVTTLEGDIVAEITRATAAESANTTAINNEVTRATAAEADLATADTNEAAARAAADTSIRTDFAAADSVITGNLTAEVTRATAAEAALATADSNEATARAAADTTLQGNIDAEATARAAGDATNAAAITSEATTARAAEAANAAAITAETTRATAAEGTEATARAAGDAALDAKIAGGYFLYTGSTAASSHSVVHNIGSKYCQVLVVDANDKVIIPDAITFVDANTLTVDFISAITCKVVVSALKV